MFKILILYAPVNIYLNLVSFWCYDIIFSFYIIGNVTVTIFLVSELNTSTKVISADFSVKIWPVLQNGFRLAIPFWKGYSNVYWSPDFIIFYWHSNPQCSEGTTIPPFHMVSKIRGRVTLGHLHEMNRSMKYHFGKRIKMSIDPQNSIMFYQHNNPQCPERTTRKSI